tara:strand:+ start:366 stop:1022 length:657 start_codon:yes stop_codon:yes gene_type:complete
MSFKKNKYTVLKNVISKDVANFCYSYFLNKRKVAEFLSDKINLAVFQDYFGTFNDGQVPNTYSSYSDIAMETLLEQVKPIMEKHTDLKLIPTYSYARIYKNGDILERHKDRASCEVSTTMNLGGDNWSIYLDPTNAEIFDFKVEYKPIGNKGIKVDLKPGDMLIYSGCKLEHWREEFKGKDCGQVFLHYNIESETSKENIYDERPFLGLPNSFKGKKL